MNFWADFKSVFKIRSSKFLNLEGLALGTIKGQGIGVPKDKVIVTEFIKTFEQSYGCL